MKKLRKISIISLSVVTVILLTAVIAVSVYMLDFSLNPKVNKGKDLKESYLYVHSKYPFIRTWLDSLNQTRALKDTFIVSPDGVRLHAIYVKANQPTGKTAFLIHGYTDNCLRMLMIGYLYHHSLGYNIFLPDLRNCGLSGGNRIQMGWLDRIDAMNWMKIANETFGSNTQMVVHGISMGGATTMMISGEPQQKYVKCFVDDCGYTSVWEQFDKELKEIFNLPKFPLLYSSNLLNKPLNGWTFKEASALKQVKKCLYPMLFIHGEKDTYVPTWMVYELYKAKPQPKELWVVPEATHAQSFHRYPMDYTERVKNFTEKYIH